MSDGLSLVLSDPLLWAGPRVAIDCRFLDRVELANRFTDPKGYRLVLAIGEIEVSLQYPGADDAAERSAQDLMVQIARLTRAAPILSAEDYERAVGERDALADGNFLPPAVLMIDGEEVRHDRVDGSLVLGVVHYKVDQVVSAAKVGDDVELLGGLVIPAAILTLALAAGVPPDIADLDERLAEYEERTRVRNPC